MAKDSVRVGRSTVVLFIQWLQDNHKAEVRDGKGAYQMCQIFLSPKNSNEVAMWHVISTTKHDSICTVPGSLSYYYDEFIKEGCQC